MKHLLFVCSRNKLRSPTAEEVFSSLPDFEVASAGLDNDAALKLTAEMVAWADIITGRSTKSLGCNQGASSK